MDFTKMCFSGLKAWNELEKPDWDLYVWIPAPLSLSVVLGEIWGSIKDLGLFLPPRNGKRLTKVQPCPTATHGTPPHKANLELFWKKMQEIFGSHENGPKWAGSHSSIASLGTDTKALISWNPRVLEVGKDPQDQIQPSTHVPHK